MYVVGFLKVQGSTAQKTHIPYATFPKCVCVCLFLSSSEDIFSLFWGFFFESERERQTDRQIERKKETHQCERETSTGCFLTHPPTGNWTATWGMCPDQESNLWPFALQNDEPTNWATLARALNMYLNDTSPLSVRNPRSSWIKWHFIKLCQYQKTIYLTQIITPPQDP